MARPHVPLEILKARGSWRAKSRERKGELTLANERPTCPSWLDKEARAEWNRQVKLLMKQKVLARVDRSQLASYCEAWSQFVRAVEFLRDRKLDDDEIKAGATRETYATHSGQLKPHPMVAIRDKASERATRIAIQFGFTPVARARIRVEQQEETIDPMEEVLNRKKSS